MKKEDKFHFKQRFRTLFKRLIRRFTFDRVYALVPDEDRKLLAHIRKVSVHGSATMHYTWRTSPGTCILVVLRWSSLFLFLCSAVVCVLSVE